MKTLQIEECNALKAYDAGSASDRKLLENLFGQKTFVRDITERVKSFEDACELIGINPVDFVESIGGTNSALGEDADAILAHAQMMLITRVLNEGWTPDWSKTREAKYYAFFSFAGSGFAFRDCGSVSTASGVGSRLCFKSSALAEYAGKQFLPIYERFMTL